MGRRKLEDNERPEVEPPTDEQLVESVNVRVEGTVLVPFYDEDKRAAKDYLRTYCEKLGLNYIETPAGGDTSMRVQKRWTRRRMPLDVALKQIEHRPMGIKIRELVEVWFRYEDEPWNEPEIKHATAKAHVMLHRLAQANRIFKRYTTDGVLILFTAGNPEADRYATDPSGRLPTASDGVNR